MDFKWSQPREVVAMQPEVEVEVVGGPAKLIGLGVGCWWIYKKMQTNSTGQDTGELAKCYAVVNVLNKNKLLYNLIT